MAKKDDQDKMPDFESALQRLEDIIENIESGETGLEKSIAEYEKGMKLITHCRGILDKAQKKIQSLTLTAEGDVSAQ